MDSIPTDSRVWSVMYTIHGPDGSTYQIQKSDDGCTRTVWIRGPR